MNVNTNPFPEYINTISVVIPVYNGRDTITILLDSLADQSNAPAEVIVVDNNSTDSTRLEIETWHYRHPEFPLVVVSENRQGRTFARNKGIHLARGDYIAFFDVDCVVNKNWMANSARFLRGKEFAVVGGVVKGYRLNTPTERILHFLHCPKKLDGIPFKSVNQWDIMRGAIETNNVLIRTTDLKEVNGFEENGYAITGEDFDLFLRLFKRSKELIGFHKELVVYHQHRADVAAMAKQVFNYGHCFAEVVSNHFQKRLILIGRRFAFSMPFPLTVWLRLSKAFVALIGAFILLPFVSWKQTALLVVFLFFFLLLSWHRRFRKERLKMPPYEFAQALGVVIIHKFLLFSGHIWGSLKHRICCL